MRKAQHHKPLQHNGSHNIIRMLNLFVKMYQGNVILK